MSVLNIPMFGANDPEDYIPDLGKKTVPLTVWVKDGHLVNPGLGERHVIGEADVDGTMIFVRLGDRIPDAVMDSLVGTDGAKFSIGFDPNIETYPVERHSCSTYCPEHG